MSLSGPGAPSGITRPDKVIVGLAHRGDVLVIALIIEKPEFLTPITVALTREQARLMMEQLAVALREMPT